MLDRLTSVPIHRLVTIINMSKAQAGSSAVEGECQDMWWRLQWRLRTVNQLGWYRRLSGFVKTPSLCNSP